MLRVGGWNLARAVGDGGATASDGQWWLCLPAATLRWGLGGCPGSGDLVERGEARGSGRLGNGMVARRRHGELELTGANGGGGQGGRGFRA